MAVDDAQRPDDISEVTAFLRELLGSGVHTVEPAGQGTWSRCFGFAWDERDLVIRFGPHVEDFERDRRAGRFRGPGLPIPAVLDIGRASDEWFAIAGRARGTFLEDADPAGWNALLPSMRALLDGLATVELSADSGWGPWASDGTGAHDSWPAFLLSATSDRAGSRTHGWRPKLAASPDGDRTFGRAADRLEHLSQKLEVERHLVHGDLLHQNVLVDNDRIAAVLDWGCSIYGDPLYDVATLAFWAPWHAGIDPGPLLREALQQMTDAGVEGTLVRRRLRACLLHISLDNQAHCAHMNRWADLAATAARTEPLLDDDLTPFGL